MTALSGSLLAATPDISDSTDFPGETDTPGLRALDEALRCEICRDLYDAPVSLNCGHSFCSVCIRSALPTSPTCPACRKPASEVHLRKNVAMEKAVAEWNKARALILRLAKQEVDRNKRSLASQPNLGERPRKRQRSGSSISTPDDDIVILPSSQPSGSATPETGPDTVDCPICQKGVPLNRINTHIDSNCKRYLADDSSSTSFKGKQKTQWSQLLTGAGASSSNASGKHKDRSKGKSRTKEGEEEPEARHLPKVAYDIHPQKRMVELLNEWGLPTHGDRNALIRRHSRWVVLYNANVDRAPENRWTLGRLRTELRKAEEAEQKTRKEVVEDPIAYQKSNKAEFAKLTEAARPRKLANPAQAKSSSEGAPSTSEPVQPQADARACSIVSAKDHAS